MNLLAFILGGLVGVTLMAAFVTVAEAKHPVYTEEDFGEYDDPTNADKD